MKIKYSFIRNLANLTDCEMNLILYLVKRQNEATGSVEGVYYRDVMQWTNMCKQSFYNARKGLVSKGILVIKHHGDKDCDVRIIGNNFPVKATPKETYADGYVKLSRPVFRSQAFKDLKAHEKYMLFEFLKSTHEGGSSMWRDIEPFIKKFEEIFQVTSRVVKGYLHSLKKFFSIGIKNGQYIITYLHSVFKDERGQR